MIEVCIPKNQCNLKDWYPKVFLPLKNTIIFTCHRLPTKSCTGVEWDVEKITEIGIHENHFPQNDSI